MSFRTISAAAILSAIAAFGAAPAFAGCDLTDPACTATDKGDDKTKGATNKSAEKVVKD